MKWICSIQSKPNTEHTWIWNDPQLYRSHFTFYMLVVLIVFNSMHIFMFSKNCNRSLFALDWLQCSMLNPFRRLTIRNVFCSVSCKRWIIIMAFTWFNASNIYFRNFSLFLARFSISLDLGYLRLLNKATSMLNDNIKCKMLRFAFCSLFIFRRHISLLVSQWVLGSWGRVHVCVREPLTSVEWIFFFTFIFPFCKLHTWR